MSRARVTTSAGRSRRNQSSSLARIIDQQTRDDDQLDFRTAAGRILALAEVQATLGSRENALESLQEARRLVPADRDALSSTAVQLASIIRVLIPAGFVNEALRELDDYLGNEAGHWSIDGLRNDPRVEPIAGNRGFRQLEEKYGRTYLRQI